jgi:NADPH:quinone reductase-like Zn-dependent oxidoreductase
VAGVIEALGPGVDNLKVGDRVSTVNAFAISKYGTFGETTLIPARALVPIPDRFTSAEAAGFGFAYMTNYFGLFEVGLLKPFQTVLVTEAGSTTGLAALPMIKSAGAISIATTRTSKKREALLALGADHVIATEEENLIERVMEITGGQGVDIAYDCAPATLGEQVVESIKLRGHWIVYGSMTEPTTFPWWPFARRSLKFDQYKVSEFAGNPAIGLPGQEEKFLQAKRIIAAAIESGQWPAVLVDKELKGLKHVPDALRYMASNQASGKIFVSL